MTNSLPEKHLNLFERYLSLWVGVCMVVGVLLGKLLPAAIDSLRRMEFSSESQINVPIAILLWLMIIPMMMKVDFASIREVGTAPQGTAGDAVRQLDRQAVLHGPDCLALLPPDIFRLDFARRRLISTLPAASSWPPLLARPWCSSGVISPMATRPTRWCRSR